MLVESLKPFLVTRYIQKRAEQPYIPLCLDALIPAELAGQNQPEIETLLADREILASPTLVVQGVQNLRIVSVLHEFYKKLPVWPDVERPTIEKLQDALIRVDKKADKDRLKTLARDYPKAYRAILNVHRKQLGVQRKRSKAPRDGRPRVHLRGELTTLVDICEILQATFREYFSTTTSSHEQTVTLFARAAVDRLPQSLKSLVRPKSTSHLAQCLLQPKPRMGDLEQCVSDMTGVGKRRIQEYLAERRKAALGRAKRPRQR